MPSNLAEKDKSFLALDDCRRLLQAADGMTYMVLRLTMASALRPSELFALRLRDVKPGKIRIEKAVIRGRLKETKTESSDGYVPISDVLYRELTDYADREGIGQDDFLFASEIGTPLERNNFRNRKLKPLATFRRKIRCFDRL